MSQRFTQHTCVYFRGVHYRAGSALPDFELADLTVIKTPSIPEMTVIMVVISFLCQHRFSARFHKTRCGFLLFFLTNLIECHISHSEIL